MFQLTKGALKRIIDGATVVDPILQILQMKNIQNNMDGVIRYKVTLYDGETQHTFGILATQKNYLVESGELKPNSVIKLQEFAANVLSKDPPKVVVILLNFEVLGSMDPSSKANSATEAIHFQPQTTIVERIQNENIEPHKGNNQQQPASKSFYGTAAAKEMSIQKASPMSTNTSLTATGGGSFNGFKVLGISSLNPYQNKWAIRARVTNKSAIRTYTNAKGEGKLFNVEFIDGTGEIRASGFNEQVDKFYDLLEIDRVFYISRCQLKTANKQYSKLENDYEMTFSNDTVIEPCNEEDNIPHMHLNLVKLCELPQKNANDFVDVLGVVKSVGEVTTIIAKATNREIKKRDLCLVDNSNCSISCTLWGKQAEDFDGSDNPVILLRGAKIGEYGGRTLSVATTTIMQLNPDIPESHTLRGWFDQGGNEIELQTLSNQLQSGGGGGATMGSNMPVTWKYLDQTKDEKLGMGDKADYFSTKAYILYAKKDNSLYMACPGDGCNKKVIDQNDGTYRCEKCARSYANFKWRMILNINIGDFTESNWTTCFQETAEQILEMSSEEVGNLKNSSDPKYDEIFGNCAFKEFIFKLRAKMETYNDERRVKMSTVSVEPLNYVQNGRLLLQKLKNYVKNNGI